MAQAFVNILSGGNIQAFSAGSRPGGRVNPKAIAAMMEINYDLTTHSSKSLDEVKNEAPFDAVVTMGCGDACPWMPAHKHIDWQIPDPRDMDVAQFNEVRDLIGRSVKQLLDTLE